MRYLILSPSGAPLEEIHDLSVAEARIHKTNDVVLYVPEIDAELDEANHWNKHADG